MSHDDIDKNLMATHNYDGIQELDNPLPTWWQAIFYGTIIFGFLYWIHYDVSQITNSDKELAEDLAKIQALQEKAGITGPVATNEEFNALLSNTEALKDGQKIYEVRCSPCHGNVGEGTIGPNLADKYWLYGGSMTDIAKSIQKGSVQKGMPAWESQLKPDEIKNLVVYVASLKGSNPANGKEPQGEPYEE